MKHIPLPAQQTPPPADLALSIAVASAPRDGTDFIPSADEVARRAYFVYVNQGSISGHEVQHWLTAEAELIADRDRTRVHGFHNRT